MGKTGHFPLGGQKFWGVRWASGSALETGYCVVPCLMWPLPLPCLQAHTEMQHYGVNGYSLHAMNSLSAMYNLHQQAAQQAQHAPDYRPSVHALTLAERLAGKGCGDRTTKVGSGGEVWGRKLWKTKIGGREHWKVSSGRFFQEDPGHLASQKDVKIQNLGMTIQSSLCCQHCAGRWSCPMPSKLP